MEKRIIRVEIELTEDNTADYAGVDPELVFEDFFGRFSDIGYKIIYDSEKEYVVKNFDF